MNTNSENPIDYDELIKACVEGYLSDEETIELTKEMEAKPELYNAYIIYKERWEQGPGSVEVPDETFGNENWHQRIGKFINIIRGGRVVTVHQTDRRHVQESRYYIILISAVVIALIIVLIISRS
jgi:hypothetical protein